MASQQDRDKLKQLNIQLRDLLTVTPKNGVYVIGGVNYNKRGYESLLEETRDEIAKVEKLISPPAQEVAEKQKRQEDLTARANALTSKLNDLEAKFLDIQIAYESAKVVEEEKRLGDWVSLIKKNIDDVQSAINSLRKGEYVDDPKFITVPSIEQARRSGPIGPATGQPVVAEPTTPAAPQAPQTDVIPPAGGPALTGGLVSVNIPGSVSTEPSDKIVAPEVTVEDTTGVKPDVVTDKIPGIVSTPTGPTYTDPATGTTYQPGQQIGGEDRALPNGGAVVNGTYIPPGIDYTWLSQQVPEDWKTAAKELYGAYYDMIKNDPQISDLLERAIKNEYSDAQFQVELEKTNWWRETTANARQFEILEATDPATARAQLDNRIALVRETAQRLGVTLSTESLEGLARNAINLGFDMTAQIEDIVGSEAIRTAGGVSQLRYGFVGDSIRKSARKYGVSLSDVTFNEWVNKIAVGSESQQTFESYAQQIARTLYPSLNNGFDRGLSFAEMTDPYAQVASRILEIPGAQVDFTDPKWAAAFTMKDTKGQQMQMSFGEWADYLRTDPSFGWEYTDDAKNRAYTVVNRLGELFGAA